MKNFNPIKGTYDYLPNVAKVREEVRHLILKNYQANGYNLIDTPILEHLDFLDSSEGGDNLKLMFKTIKRGSKLDLSKVNLTEADITEEGLRYDLTVPLARFYSNNREKLPVPFKALQIGSVFRAENPQRGRNRQFIQCDIDVFGDSSINAELELLKTAVETYEQLGFEELTIKVNDRAILNSLVLRAGFDEKDLGEVCIVLDKLDKVGITGIMMELIDRGFDTEHINKLIEILNWVLNKGIGSLDLFDVDEEKLNNLKYLLTSLVELIGDNHFVKFDISLVRGQGYYTGTVFEIYTEGFSGAIGGGGRYDNMVEKFSGKPSPVVGYSIGFEPVTMLMLENSKQFASKTNLALVYDEQDDIIEVFKAKDELKKDYNVSLYLRVKNMKNFYDKITSVATCTISFREYKEGKEVKILNA